MVILRFPNIFPSLALHNFFKIIFILCLGNEDQCQYFNAVLLGGKKYWKLSRKP